jgi:hypothetical protein
MLIRGFGLNGLPTDSVSATRPKSHIYESPTLQPSGLFPGCRRGATRTIEHEQPRPEYLDANPSDRLTVGDLRFRKEPNEEEEEEEEDKIDEGDSEKGGEGDDDENSGYSV